MQLQSRKIGSSCTNKYGNNDFIIEDGRSTTTTYIIPRCLHFIWLGPKPLPRYPSLSTSTALIIDGEERSERNADDSFNETMQSWKKHHPGWNIQLWNEDSIETLFKKLVSKENRSAGSDHDHDHDHSSIACLSDLINLYHECIKMESGTSAPNYGMASDIARILILYEYGGTYIDVDYYCVDSIDQFHRQHDFFCGASNSGCIEFNNGLIGSTPQHSFLGSLVERISNWYKDENSKREKQLQAQDVSSISMISSFLDETTLSSLKEASLSTSYTPMEVISHTGPGLLTRALLDQFRQKDEANCKRKNDNFRIMPSHVFNAVPNTHKKLGLGTPCKDENVYRVLEQYIRIGETKAVHLWSCSWQP